MARVRRPDSLVGAIGKHLALIGFMGAGKTTIGREVAELTQRPFVDTDAEIERRHGPIPELFERGEPEFRQLEEAIVTDVLRVEEPAVIALGGGALESVETRALLRRRAFTAYLDVDVAVAWERAAASDRPLARQETAFRALYEARLPVYRDSADAVAKGVDDVLLASLGVGAEPGEGPFAVVADERVLALHDPPVDGKIVAVPPGEAAKQIRVAERVWDELELDRHGTVVGFGGGTTTDLAGFAAATYLRGLDWVAVPTTLVGQVDAAIGGKTGIDLGKGKNLVGAFHYPRAVRLDPSFLSTLPGEERQAGMAEVVKTGLLAGEDLWELPEAKMVRAAAAFKCAVCLSDPFERSGRRSILNLGHTFAHALEAASDFRLRHGDAVALGLGAALRLSGQPTAVVDDLLRPQPVRVDRERAWAAMRRDKKAIDGRLRLVLLDGPGRPRFPAELPEADVRAALDSLIAD